MRKNVFCIAALVLACAFSGFANNRNPSNRLLFMGCWYLYSGNQTLASRENSANYTHTASTPDCVGIGNECAVELNFPGPCPTNPDFSNITFDANGFPNGNKAGHSDFIVNLQKN